MNNHVAAAEEREREGAAQLENCQSVRQKRQIVSASIYVKKEEGGGGGRGEGKKRLHTSK